MSLFRKAAPLIILTPLLFTFLLAMYYPQPLHPPQPAGKSPQPLTELGTPPSPQQPPSFPHYLTSATPRTLVPGWTVTTHVCQSAFPRANVPNTPCLPRNKKVLSCDPKLSPPEKKARATSIVKHIQECRASIDSAAGSRGPSDDVLWTVINRYFPSNSRHSMGAKGITIFAVHAGGFHKEIWETTFKQIIACLESKGSGPVFIEEIWSMDLVNHGDSAIINEAYLQDACLWADNARDIANCLLNYLPETTSSTQDIPFILPPLSTALSKTRKEKGFSSRTIVGLGHSVGASSMLRGAMHYPRLISSLVLVDPVVVPFDTPIDKRIYAHILGAAARQMYWPTARADFLKSPFIQPWDSRVLEDYLTYGLYEVDGGVQLKCSSYQQTATILEITRLPSDLWELLPSFEKNVPLRWIMDGRDKAASTGGEEITRQAVWRRPENSSNILIPAVGHLAVNEAPDIVGTDVAEFIVRTYGAFTVKSKL
ncbi:hypothetical protein BDV93DRAFT_553555 [Ceratobasidium sp. AG-I]|nr:hypothetical protein BDV93DRAFT_553555 [Ceratobasidium sp. AG-I]